MVIYCGAYCSVSIGLEASTAFVFLWRGDDWPEIVAQQASSPRVFSVLLTWFKNSLHRRIGSVLNRVRPSSGEDGTDYAREGKDWTDYRGL